MADSSKGFNAIFAAFDLGAGNVKAVVASRRRQHTYFSMPSLICRVSKESVQRGDRHIFDSDVFHIGDEEFWFAGSGVSEREFVSDDAGEDANLKITNASYFLMSSLILGGYVRSDILNKVGLVVSHHAPDKLGSTLREKIEGERIVTHNDKTYKMCFHLPEQGVYLEASQLIASDKRHGVLDLGYLTALWTQRNSKGAVTFALPTDAGVNRLISMICESHELRSHIGGVAPNRDKVVEAISSASQQAAAGVTSVSVVYRDKKAIDIKRIYAQCLQEWIKVAATPAVDKLQEQKGTDFKVIAIGGGAKLPGVEKILKRCGIDIYSESDPIYANCDSLYRAVMPTAIRDRAFEGWFDDDYFTETEAPAMEAA